jgi:hypothetical protein
MTRLLLVDAVVLVAASCGSSDKNRAVPLAVVKRALGDAHLRPQKVRLIVQVATDWTPPKAVNYCGQRQSLNRLRPVSISTAVVRS